MSENATDATTLDPEVIEKWRNGEITIREIEGISLEDYAGIANVGHVLLEQGKVEEALQVYEGARAMDPNHAYVRAALGAIYMRLGRPIDALNEFNETLRLDPDNIHALVNRGEMLLNGGLLAEAARDFKRAIDLDPEGQNAASMRARALVSVVKDMLEKAASGESAEAGA